MSDSTTSFFSDALRRLCATRTERAPFSNNAQRLLRERYLATSTAGEIVETPEGMLARVASALAQAERDPTTVKRWEIAFYEIMARLEFHPGSRTLANAGSPWPQLANCFVFPLEDSQASVLQTFTESSVIKGLGGGCGYNFSRLRPRGDQVRGEPGMAAGPTAFLRLFDEATKTFRQRGRYESGNMAILNVDHPDVLEFIAAKRADGSLSMTNISLGVSDTFMQAVAADAAWELVNPRTGELVRSLPAREVFGAACRLACETGDPGLVFLDRVNRDNPLRYGLGDIVATNPCGEIGLYPYESCNLGYLNLPRFLLPAHQRSSTNLFNIERLRTVMAGAVRMIDNAITVAWFPIERIRQSVAANRRIGIGVTGWAECLAAAGIPYDSDEALRHAESLAELLREAATAASYALGKERGPFPNVVHTPWRESSEQPRNVALLALPPSGNNAVIFDTSFSIEPFFGMVYTQRVLGDQELRVVNQLLLRRLNARGAPKAGLLEAIVDNHGSVRNVPGVPEDIQEVFKTAHDIAPDWHVRMQAAFQRHVDNAVTKTVNLPRAATPDQVAQLYQFAWESDCKGITVYRDRSRAEQAIEFSKPAVACDQQSGTCTTCE